ncbi:DMT family transporter [Vreelandella olivaria]|uniref:DMT family transporter n=1 Tax=Vreelandella olivaria TaxID=390919 RepID=UPI00201F28CE|nr:DMT family transporter [Halomonas olivaria]
MTSKINIQLEVEGSSSSLLIGVTAGIFAAIIWGLWPVLTRFGVTSNFTAQEIVAVRFVFAGLMLLPYYFRKRVWQRISPIKSFIIASGAGAIYVYVSALGLQYVPAGHLGVVETGTMLILSALGGYLFLNERKTYVQVMGYCLIFGGLALVNWQSLAINATPEILLGDLYLVLGGVLWASYTILTKKWGLVSWDAVAAVSVWSLLTWVPLIILFGDFHLDVEEAGAWLVQGVGQGIITAVLGLWLYSVAVEKLGASRGSLFGALVPAFAMIGGLLFLLEVPTSYEIIGVFLTTLGILVSIRR